MGSLDSLQIQIKASTKEAIGAIDNLITKFGALNNALNNFKPGTDYINGLENLISGMRNLAAAVNSVDPTRMKDITKALGGMTSVGEKMSKLSGIRVVGKDLGNVSTASQRATEEAKKFGKAWGVVDDEGIAELAKEFDHLYASVGNEQEMRSAAQNMEGLVQRFGTFTNEMSEDARTMLRDIQQTFIKLPKGWQDNLIMPTVNGQKLSPEQMRGYVGIKKSATNHAGSTVEAIQENPQWGIDATGLDDYQAAQALFERIADLLGTITEETREWNELSRGEQSNELAALQAHIENVVSELDKGIETANLFKETVAQADDDFMNIDEEDVYEVSTMAQATENLAGTLTQVEQYTNAFDPLISALHQLKDASLPESLSNLQYIKDAISKIGGTAGANAGSQLAQIADGIRAFEGVTIPNFGENLPNLARGLRSLGSGNIVTASQALPFVADGLRQLNGVTITADAEAIANLAHAVSRFGLANITKAVTNIPPLAQSLRELMQTLSTAPQVNTNTVRLVEALSNLNVRSLNTSGGVDRLSGSLRRYRGHARNAQKATKSLASVIGKVYATYWLLFRGIQKFGKAIDLASQLKEVQNVVDVTFGEMSDKMDDFSKKAVDTLGMSELTAKQIGSKYQAMGTAMGITKDMVRETNAFVQTATDGYADVANSMGDISINLTRLAGDMASFYNMDYEEVGEKLQAVFTGQTRPMRAFGVDLTQASLQAFALAHGLDADVKSMTQAEKTLLRYQYVMANTVAAQGDFIRTQDTWANTTKVATERIKQLGIVLGQIGIYTFKPLVQNFNKAMESIIKNATATLNALGKIFGWQVEWTDGGVLRDEEDAAGDLADDMGDAADNAKKFKNFLLGIDELNLLPDDKDKNKGDGSGLGDLLGDYDMNNGLKIKPFESGFESLYDTLFKLGKRINEVIKDLLKNLDWDYIYEKARMFGKGLADFLNGYLSDAELFYEKGRFLANGINTIANALDAFFKRFNGWQLGVDFGTLINGFTENLDWAVIKSAAYEMAHDIAEAINGALYTTDWSGVGRTIAEGLNTAFLFLYTIGDEIEWKLVGQSLAEGINSLFTNFDFKQAAQTLNRWAKGLLDALIQALDKTDWELVGRSIGEFIANIDILSIAGRIGAVLWEAINAAVSTWSGLFDAAPIETALVTALAIPFSNRYFRRNFASTIMTFSQNVGRSLAVDLGRVFNGSIFDTFMTAFANAPIGMNTLTTMTQGLAAGFNAVSASLSTATKAVGSLGVGFAEFFIIKDSVYDLVTGTDNVAESILKIAGAATVCGTALSALLGWPAGLIATLAVGAVAGLVGVVNGFMENELKDFDKAISDALTVEDGYDVIDYTNDLAESVRNAAGDFDILAEKSGSITELKTGIGEQMEEIDLSVQKLDLSLKSQIEILPEDIAKIVDLFKGLNNDLRLVLGESYDIVVAGIGGWSDELTDQFNASKPQILQAVYSVNEDLAQEITDLDTEIANLYTAYETHAIDDTEFYKSLAILLDRQHEVQIALGVITDEVSDFQKVAEGIDLSKMFVTNADGVKELSKDYEKANENLRSEYDTTIDAIDTGGQEVVDILKRWAEEAKDINGKNALLLGAEMEETDVASRKEEVKAAVRSYYYDIQEEMLNGYADLVEAGKAEYAAHPVMYGMLGISEATVTHNLMENYRKNVIQPFVEQAKEEWGDVLSDEDLYAFDVAESMSSDMFYLDIRRGPGQHSTYEMRDNWESAVHDALKNLPKIAEEEGEKTWSHYHRGFSGARARGELDDNTFNANGVKEYSTEVEKATGSTSSFVEMANSLDISSVINKDISAMTDYTSTTESAADATNMLIDMAKEANKTTSGSGNNSSYNGPFRAAQTVGMNNTLMKTLDLTGDINKSTENLNLEEAPTKGAAAYGNYNSVVQTATTNTAALSQENSTAMQAISKNTSGMQSAIGNVFGSMKGTMSTFMSDYTKTVEGKFSANHWTNMMSGIPKAFEMVWKQAISAIKSVWNPFARQINSKMKIQIPSVELPNGQKTANTDIRVKVPEFSTGGFPEDGLFFANHTEMVGQFSNGRTAVANNEQIIQGIKQGVYEAVMSAYSATGGQNVNVELAGDAATFFTAMVKENNNYVMRTGASPMRI